MRQATSNVAVNSKLESQIREAQRNMQYFEQTLQSLQARRMGDGMQNLSLSGGSAPPHHGMPDNGLSGGGHNNQLGHGGGGTDYGNPGPGGYSQGATGLMPPRAPYAPSGPSDRSPAARPNYGKLGEL
jgi:classical protein kinase C